MKKVTSVEELVEALGGLTKAGQFFGVERQQMFDWLKRGKIPCQYIRAQDRLSQRGLNLPDELFNLHPEGRLTPK